MNEREELLLLLKQASTAIEKTQEKLNNAEKVVAEWATLPTTHKEHWDNATLKFKRKTIEEWEQEVEKLEKEVEDAKQEVRRKLEQRLWPLFLKVALFSKNRPGIYGSRFYVR